jgi:hypothetical protein
MQRTWIVLQFDHGSGYEHKQQMEGLCHHSKTSPLMVFYIHHSPKFDSTGKKVSHTTDVRTYWADDNDNHVAKKDCHYFYSALLDIDSTYIGTEAHHIMCPDDKPEYHGWADGCGEQNKGRRTFRMLTEFAAGTFRDNTKRPITLNHACTGHFGGVWDADGGRQCKNCFQCEKRADSTHPTTGQPLGRLLPSARDCVDYLNEQHSNTRSTEVTLRAAASEEVFRQAMAQQLHLEGTAVYSVL